MDFLRGFSAFLDFHYWINQRPVPLGPSLAAGILIFFAWFILVAIILLVLARGYRSSDPLKFKLLRRFSRLFGYCGSIGLALLFFAYEQAPLLSMRLWVLLLTIWFLARLIMIIVFAVRDYPKHKRDVAERQRLEKWLPGKGK